MALKGHSCVFHKAGQIIGINVGHNLSAIPSGHKLDFTTFYHEANDENLNFVSCTQYALSIRRFLKIFPICMSHSEIKLGHNSSTTSNSL